jgi:RNA 2',3'-cyclic 3'-phosphodiesterase
MEHQLSFPALDLPSARRQPQAMLPRSPLRPWNARYQRTDVFFAIYPPDDIGADIDQRTMQLKTRLRLKGNPLGHWRYHATLCPIGVYSDLPDGVIDAVAAAAATISTSPFDVAFDRIESFPRRQGKRPMVLLGDDGVAGLVALQRQLETTLRKIGFPQWVTRPYNPHVTLLYDEQEMPRQTIEPVRWTVREFALVRSLIGEGRHMKLRQPWQLHG